MVNSVIPNFIFSAASLYFQLVICMNGIEQKWTGIEQQPVVSIPDI
jgi:hypothetical protein